jgi:predicted transposase YbfD/YdcC
MSWNAFFAGMVSERSRDSRRQNRCHRVLDMVFGEDRCRVRDPNAARCLSLLREAVLKTLRASPKKGTLESRR